MKPKQPAKKKKPVVTRKAKQAASKSTRSKSTRRKPGRVRAKKPAPKPRASKRRRIVAGRRHKVAAKKTVPAPLALPAVLFEGDRPGVLVSSPGERPALSAPESAAEFIAPTELPEAYGTQHVLVAARDPHWLYVHWDLTREQLRDYNTKSVHRHLVLRVAKNGNGSEPTGEVHVHPESRHWFVHVADAGVKYTVELGYYGKTAGWTNIATSAPTLAPPDVAAANSGNQFATIPTDVALTRLVEIVGASAAKNLPLAHALEELRVAGHPELPAATDQAATTWTPEQERALAEVIHMKQLGRVSVGSLDITELVRRGLQEDFSSIMAALAGLSNLSSLSSPHGGLSAGPADFWFNVNAELIIYGATEPNARITIGGRPVKLRPDGSFSFRFALPDGQYELPVTAVSGDGTEARHADLKFSRATERIGDVGAHPQDPALKTPTPENAT
ncbi:MAG: hypothetical protein RLY20_921 [Verrucomicrobiota bacterium]